MANPKRVRDWLKGLGMLVASNVSAQEAAAKIDAMVPFLAEEFRDETFCKSSLAAVARQQRFFPEYATLCDLLVAWRAEHGPPAAPALTGPSGGNGGVTATTQSWIDHFYKRQGEDFANGNGYSPEVARKILLSLIRSRDIDAWRHITGSLGELAERAPSADELAAAEAAVERMKAELRA